MDRAQFYRDARDDVRGPLDGVRVLDVTTVWSGPMASCILADLGCDVIRVEMPRNRGGQLPPTIPGTGLSWFHETVNRNKRSVGLDLRVPEARPVFLRLAASVDILVENFRPGTLDEWDVGFERCRGVNPGLVFVSISGFGQYGPKRGLGGYDPVVQAASGWMSLNGAADGAPVKAPTFLADDLAALHAAVAALAALRHRDRTGEGQHVDISMLDTLLYSSDGFLTLGATGVPLRRWGDETEFLVPSNRFRCADGDVYLVVALDRQWRRLADLMGVPELARAPGFATNAERRANRAAVNEVIAQWCRPLPADKVVEVLCAADLAAAKLGTFADAARDPHVHEREMLRETTLSNGSTAPLVGPAAKFSRTPAGLRSGAPVPGADTDAVLSDVGVTDDELATLRAHRAI